MTDRTLAPPIVSGSSPRTRVLSVFVLSSFAFSQPILDLLGRNAVFFLARAAPPIDAVLLALVTGVIGPALLGLAVELPARWNERLARTAHLATLGVLFGSLVVTIAARTPARDLDGKLILAAGAAAGASFALAYRRFENVRLLVKYATPAPIVFVLVFLFASPTSTAVIQSQSLSRPGAVDPANPAPVVLVIFDEFPTVSLMDGSGNLEEDVYPNFARLAGDGTWFRNAVTVRQQTEDSVPAILTGSAGSTGRLPFASSYPNNLFTVLSDGYDLHVLEAVTGLCPDYACQNRLRQTEPFANRWKTMVSDVTVILGHLLIPRDLTGRLPSIDESWGDFRNTAAASPDTSDEHGFDIIEQFRDLDSEDRRKPVSAFIESITPAGGQPPLYFGHFLLPHIPWRYLPTGQEYPAGSPIPGSATTGWTGDAFLVAQAYQRHLLQVQLVDGLLGNILDRLDAADLYDPSLIIVLADHGITIRPEVEHRRVVTGETLADVAAVPLFIKRPYESGGTVDDYRAETTDVLPTIADILGFTIPWQTTGFSLFADERPERTATEVVGTKGPVMFDAAGLEILELAGEKAAWFHDKGPAGFAPAGYEHLLGMSSAEVTDTATADSIEMDHPERYVDVDPASAILPARVTGTFRSSDSSGTDVYLAVVMNNHVVAVTRTFSGEDGSRSFSAMLPHTEFREGYNQVEFFLVEDAAKRVLSRLLDSDS
ncbi:MAG TPA: sulfatase-like hydrolase/transferase [Acidimicrobiia bacterium]|nr:sulfatase-like hydrolase/transferase [Acidimicrobiia bacterium]